MSPPSDISTFNLNASQKSWPIIISSCLLECNIAPGCHVLGIWNCTLQLSIDKPFIAKLHQGSKTLFSILSSTGYFSNRCYFCLFSPKGISQPTHLSLSKAHVYLSSYYLTNDCFLFILMVYVPLDILNPFWKALPLLKFLDYFVQVFGVLALMCIIFYFLKFADHKRQICSY